MAKKSKDEIEAKAVESRRWLIGTAIGVAGLVISLITWYFSGNDDGTKPIQIVAPVATPQAPSEVSPGYYDLPYKPPLKEKERKEIMAMMQREGWDTNRLALLNDKQLIDALEKYEIDMAEGAAAAAWMDTPKNEAK